METTYHYGNLVTLGFDPVKHRYYIDDEPASGVTSVLSILAKPALIVWAARCAAEFIEEALEAGKSYDEVQIKELAKSAMWAHRNNTNKAADTGTLIHSWIENFVLGKNPSMPVNEGMQKAVKSFIKWYEQQDIEVIKPEIKLCSKEYNLAGTADLLCRIDGKLTIVDWKTGSGIYPEMLLQMGAYSMMYEEEYGEKIEQVTIVNCSVKAKFGTLSTTKVPFLKKTYIDVLKLSKNLQSLEELMKG